jgi:HK97 family phage major capsid protein
MTTPAQSSLVRSSFGGVLTPAQVHELLNALVTGAPFSASLTRAGTSTGTLAFPTVGPTGWSWLEELQAVPDLLLGDESLIIQVCKLAGALPVSSEMLFDSTVNITVWVGDALRDSLSRDLDLGVLRGTGRPQPSGIIAQADEVTGATLLAAAGAAIASIGEKGGQADSIALSPTMYSAELTAVDTTGRPIHPGGLPELAGLRIIQVPDLGPPLVYDSRRCFLVVGQDSSITVHDDYKRDAQVLLVKARVNIGVPVKDKSLRKLAITPAATRASAKG